MPLWKNEKEKITFAQDMQRYGMTDWDKLLIENAKMTLESKPKSNEPDDVINFYGSAIRTASLLKTKAKELSSLLDALVGYMEKNCPRHLSNAEMARDSALGLIADNYELELAKNGSGPLTLKTKNSTHPKIQDGQTIKSNSLERPEKSRSSVDSKSSEAVEKKTSSSPLGLIVSSIVLLAIVLATWLKFRKPKPTS